MSTFKRSISLLLVLGILLGVLAPAAQAAPTVETASVNTDNVTIEGTNGFGNLLSQEIAENQEEAEAADIEYPGGYTVTGLVIEGNTATVTYDTMEEATLVVALYTEDGMQLVTSANVAVNPNVTTATVTFGKDMPEYFLASAYLLDSYDLSPLCVAYDTPMYTREMQELLASTVDDYDPEKILNLDEDETTNFAVYADSTIVIDAVEGVNSVESINEENESYVIKNADEQFTSLVEGDVFVYPYAEGEILIVKVASITVDGTTATITGTELELEEVFSYMKIESSSETADMTVDDSTAAEGINYVGLEQEAAPQAWEGGGSSTASHTFKVDIKEKAESDYLDASIFITGSLKVSIDVGFNYYISLSRQFIEFKAKPSVTLGVTITGNVTGKYSIGHFGVTPVAGVFIGFSPEIELKYDGTIDLSANVSMTIGFAFSSDKGFENLTTKPKVTFNLSVEGKLFFGVDFKPNAKIIHEKVASFTVGAAVGFELTAKMSGTLYEIYESDAEKKHTCTSCLGMDVNFKATLDGELKFLNCDWLTLKVDVAKLTFDLGSWYRSSEEDSFKKGKCPNYMYRITAVITDEDNEYVKDAVVSFDTYAQTTNENGIAVFYLTKGKYVLKISDGVLTNSWNVNISEPRKFALSLLPESEIGDSTDTEESGTILDDIDEEDIEEGWAVDTSIIDSGTCGYYGDNITWTLYSSGLLSFTGSDLMDNYGQYDLPAWSKYHSDLIQTVEIEDGITSIGSYAFFEHNILATIHIPESITEIGHQAFHGCNMLSSVSIPEGVTKIGYSAFYACDNLTEVTIPGTLKEIEDNLFGDCDNLISVYILEGVEVIGQGAFRFCDNLARVVMPDTVEEIQFVAFEDCRKLRDINLSGNLKTIGNSAFMGCDGLVSIVIPDSVETMGDAVFDDCSGLTNVVLSESLTKIPQYAFRSCYSLTSITIPASVETIGSQSFRNCRELETVYFVGNAPTIPVNLFYGVEELVCYYPADNPTWTSDIMQNYGSTITWVPYTPSEGNALISGMAEISTSTPGLEPNAVYPGDYSTIITDTYTLKTASFANLVPGEQYVLLAMVSIDVGEPLASDNLLFIDQAAALENGTLTFRYVQRTPCDISYVVACGASHKNLNDAEITFPEMVADCELQVVNPVVIYNGVTLVEGRDYIVVGKVDFTEAGEYICYIRGIRNYTGLVESVYTVDEHTHSFTNYVSDNNATCTEDGTKTAKCDHCDATDTIPDAGSALGHDMGSWETTVPATCTENGEEQRTCSRCDHSESRLIEAVGHSWDNGVVTREPTEDTEGERLYTCTACGATRTETIPVIGHEHRYETVVTAPTCTERGYTTYTCKCGESYVADYVDALGHSFGDWNVIQEPTTTEDGLEERSCNRCGHSEQRSIAKLENPFNDVAPGSFYYEPVMWAIENGITNGTSATTFSPNEQCMRAHVVTFLWRAVGSPEPKLMVNPFVDVKPTDFYYKPVLWALENGITSGMDATHFGPTSYCNRAQVVTFLYRTMGSPELESAENPFTDVAKGSFYEKPVLWAVKNGITNGLSATTFGPNTICNRAQIVTFLYRAFVD